MLGFPWRPESAEGARGLSTCSWTLYSMSHFKRSRTNQKQTLPTASWFGWRCVEMSGNYVTPTSGRTNHNDYSQKSLREDPCWFHIPNISALHQYIPRTSTRSTPLLSWILTTATICFLSSRIFIFLISSTEQQGNLGIFTPCHVCYANQGTRCLPAARGVNPKLPSRSLSNSVA